MGKYHPHGDQSIYDALVRMAQDFSMRLPLIAGQGNFGSMDADPPAAMRYTEARLARVAETLLADIDKDTVDFQANYDETTLEPTVLPAAFPNLLANGAGGIAVGMATNIPPHNLGELIDACCALIDNPELTVPQLMEYVPGPDFPTGATILGRNGIRAAYELGRGSVIMRARTKIEEMRGGREAIIVSEIPYQENKARLHERIAEVVRDKRVEGISEVRDESDRDGVRMVIELKRDAMSDVVLNQLYRFTPLQTSFGVNALALDGGRPRLMSLKELLEAFIRFRAEVITRRTKFELNHARNRAHVLVGLAIAVANIDEVIAMIRRSPDPVVARERLMGKEWPASDVAPLIELIAEPGREVAADGTYKLSEAQARAILELRLQRLTGLERDKIAEELSEVAKLIEGYLELLGDRDKLFALMRQELLVIKEQFATPRRTEILDNEFEQDIEDLIQREDMAVTVTHGGYVKRVPVSAYRAQRRGGKGRSGMATREDDFVSSLFVANTHTPVLFFSSRGIVYKLKVWKLPLGAPQARGKAFVNLLPLGEGETISAVMPMPEDEASWATLHVMFATARGGVRRNELSDFVSVNQSGKIAMKFEGEDSGDRLIGVSVCSEEQDVLLATRQGRVDALPRRDGARLPEPRLDRRARHRAGRRRRGDLDVAVRQRQGHHDRRTRRLPPAVACAAPGGECGGGGDGRRGNDGAGGDIVVRALRRTQGQGGVRPYRRLVGLRQAHLGLRVSGDRPWRQRRRADESRQGRRDRGGVPRARQRPGHAGHRRRHPDPLSGRWNPHCGTRHARRAHCQRERGRARRLGGSHRRGRCRQRKRKRQRREPFRNKRWIRTSRVAKTPPPQSAHKGETWPQNAPVSIRARSTR